TEVLSDATGAIHLANEVGSADAQTVHTTLMALLNSNLATVATTHEWLGALAAQRPLPGSDLVSSATAGARAFPRAGPRAGPGTQRRCRWTCARLPAGRREPGRQPGPGGPGRRAVGLSGPARGPSAAGTAGGGGPLGVQTQTAQQLSVRRHHHGGQGHQDRPDGPPPHEPDRARTPA